MGEKSNQKDSNGAEIWNSIIKTAIKLPLVKVNREKFLKKELAPYYDENKINDIIKGDITEIVPKPIIDKISTGCIKYHLIAVCSTSALAGVPGGWAMLGTIPADITQFYAHIFALIQKLIYLYGYPEINSETDLNDGVAEIMTIFTGIMMGSRTACDAAKIGLKEFAAQVSKRLPQYALTKTAIYPIVKTVAKWIGIKVTTNSFAKGVGKIIPIVGAPVSAGITYFTFKPMAKKLKSFLDSQYIMEV